MVLSAGHLGLITTRDTGDGPVDTDTPCCQSIREDML